MKKSKLSNLLQENPMAYYWIGFILADGSITNNRIKIGLAEKDSSHLAKFLEFVEYSFQGIKKSISLMDTQVVKEICKKFDFKKTKTYNPPEVILDNLFTLALIIGFIDGDGCIGYQFRRNDIVIRIKNHSSWLHVLKQFRDIISSKINVELPNSSINNQGYAQLVLSDSRAIKLLKNYTIEFNLPVLERKWNKIDLNYKSRTEKKIENKKLAEEYYKSGVKKTKIAKLLNVSNAAITGYLKEVS